MPIDNKYGRITTEFGSIGEDEPVVLFRARDVLLPEVLAHYLHKCWQRSSPDKHLALIRDTQKQVEHWQTENAEEVRTPTSTDYDPNRKLVTTETEKWPFGSSSRHWSHWRRVAFRPQKDITSYELAVCVKLLTLNAEEMYFPRLDSDSMKDHFGKEWEDIVIIDRHFIDWA